MKSKRRRYLVSILVPPLVAAIVFGTLMLWEVGQYPRVTETLALFAYLYAIALLFCLLPSQLFYLALEYYQKRLAPDLNPFPKLLFAGSLLGLFCGISISFIFGKASFVIFCPIGILAGAISTWTNYGGKRRHRSELAVLKSMRPTD